MEMGQLNAFKQVIETGSFTKAAEVLYISQPAVSHHIKSLEEELKQPLFERAHRRIKPTYAGKVFYEYVQRILNLIEESKASLNEMAAGDRGRVTVAAIGTSAIYVLPDFLYEFRATRPNVQVALFTVGGEEIRDMVMTDQVDLGIIGSHIVTHDLERIPLFEDQIRVLVHPEHPCAASGRTSLTRLAQEPFIQFGSWITWKNYILSIFNRIGIPPQEQFQVDSIDAVKRLVERGLGFTIAPIVAAQTEIKAGTLVPIELTDVEPLSRQVLLIYRREKYKIASIRIFTDELVAYMKRLRI